MTRHCPHCGALLEPSNKLLDAVKEHNEEAILQLYKMEAHRIYTKIRSKGIEEEAKALIDPAFKDLLEQLPSLNDISEFETLLDGVSDNAAYQYIVENHLEVNEREVEDKILPIDEKAFKKSIRKAYEYPTKKKSKKIVLTIVIIAVLIGSAGIFGYDQYQNKGKNHTLKAYAAIADEYQNAKVVSMASDAIIKKQYPKTYKAMEVVDQHSYENGRRISRKLTATTKDLNHDGQKELILGFLKNKKTYVTGIYHYNQKKKTAVPYDLFDDVVNYQGTTLTNEDHLIVKDQKKKGTVYSVEDDQLKTIKSNVTDPSDYLKKSGEKEVTLPTSPLSTITKQYHETTKSKVTSVLAETYNVNKTVSSYDLDGDGKKDSIKLSYMSKGEYDESYEGYYHVTVNGNVYKINCSEYMDGYLSLIRAQNGSMFVLTHTEGMDEHGTWVLSAYKDGRLVKLDTRSEDQYDDTGDYIEYSDFFVTGNQLTIIERVSSSVASSFDMTSVYDLSKGKATLASKDHQIYQNGMNSLDDTKLVLKTARAFKTYKTAACHKTGIIIPAGVKVTVESMRIMDDYNAYKIVYNGRSGYIQSDPNGSNQYFSDLEYGQ